MKLKIKKLLVSFLALLCIVCYPNGSLAGSSNSEMQWGPDPEVLIKKGEPADYDGVLLPEINYKNYKKFEQFQPTLMQTIEGNNTPIVCPDGEKEKIWTFVVAMAAGFAIGALAFHK